MPNFGKGGGACSLLKLGWPSSSYVVPREHSDAFNDHV
jgi:hypothetical protein